MSDKPHSHREDNDDETPPEGAGAVRRGDEDADFAAEHESTTFADEMEGGPEGIKEPESPRGRGGDGGMD